MGESVCYKFSHLLLKNTDSANLYLIIMRKYYIQSSEQGCICTCIRSWLGKCIQCTVQLILKVQCMGDADAGICTSCPFTVIHINQIDCTAGTFDKCIGDRSFLLHDGF